MKIIKNEDDLMMEIQFRHLFVITLPIQLGKS
jgi:hypothetical protein